MLDIGSAPQLPMCCCWSDNAECNSRIMLTVSTASQLTGRGELQQPRAGAHSARSLGSHLGGGLAGGLAANAAAPLLGARQVEPDQGRKELYHAQTGLLACLRRPVEQGFGDSDNCEQQT